VYSGMLPVFDGISSDQVESLSCAFDEKSRRLYVTANYDVFRYGVWTAIDTDTWTVTAAAGRVYSYQEENGCIYALRGQSDLRLVCCPVHTLDDLKVWAEELLEGDVAGQ
ncbi:MAG: hypothetical protein IJM13_01115, partial [Lachnospiraceae bacterium]|nr:hypothetical protein [Lachnospiraceae bacterium]